MIEMFSSSAFIDDSIDMLEQLIAYMKKTRTSGSDFPPVETYLEKVKSVMEKSKPKPKPPAKKKNEEVPSKTEKKESPEEKMRNFLLSVLEEHSEL